MSTVGLCMIVKDEESVVRTAIESVKPYIGFATIVDTGSSDGTMSVAQAALDGVPNQILQRPWVDFGTNRTEAFDYNREHCDWHLVLDADDALHFASGQRPELPFTAGAAQINVHHVADNQVVAKYPRLHYFNTAFDWRYEGVLHEFPTCDEPFQSVALEDPIYMHYSGRGARSQVENKARGDAEVLFRALKKDPTNSRYAFYLANSFKDARMIDEAIQAYQVRVAMEGWTEEVYCSWLYMGRMYMLKENFEDARLAFLEAARVAPWRREALGELDRLSLMYQGGPYLFQEP